MKSVTRTAALLTGAVVMLVAPVVVVKARSDPPDPRISVGAAAPATLVPGDARDAAGRMIAGAVWTGLVSYDPRTGATVNAAAESVTSPDGRVWTVRLKAGGRFHDGSAVTAGSFAGAWTAVLREGWHGAPLLADVARVKGAGRAVKTGRADGIEAVDERTLRVTLDRPLGGFPSLLADPAFLPMPDAVLRSRDWGSYGRLPIGNGPYRVRSHDAREVTLVRQGARTIVVKAVDTARQYKAVQAGDLDVATAVPGREHQSMDGDFPRRHLAVPGRAMTYLGIPEWDKRFASATLRQALSMAIDRAAVADGALDYQVSPANSLVPAGILPGHREGQCRVCVHDLPAAAAALTDAGGLNVPVMLWYEEGSGDEAWIKAVAGQLRAGLKLDIRPKPVPGAEFRKALADKRIDGPFAVHSTAAYPSPVGALTPLLNAPTGYRDRYPAGLLDQAERAARFEDSITPARLAESALLRDMPAIPLWAAHDHLVWSGRVRGVTADAFGGLRLDRLTIKH